MAKAKDFTANTSKVKSAIQTATETPKQERKDRKTYTPEEATNYINDFKTAGRKGVKMPRINLAFSQDNYDYIKTMSIVSGISMTEYVNKIIAQYAEEHRDVYEQALRFRTQI